MREIVNERIDVLPGGHAFFVVLVFNLLRKLFYKFQIDEDFPGQRDFRGGIEHRLNCAIEQNEDVGIVFKCVVVDDYVVQNLAFQDLFADFLDVNLYH